MKRITLSALLAAVAIVAAGCFNEDRVGPAVAPTPDAVIDGTASGSMHQFLDAYQDKGRDLRLGGPTSCLSKNVCVQFVAGGVNDTLIVVISIDGYGTVAGSDFEAWLIQADFDGMEFAGIEFDDTTICSDWIYADASDAIDPGVTLRAGGFTVPADVLHCDESVNLMFLVFDNVDSTASITITDVYDDLAAFPTGCGDTY